jgi:CMP-N,N'-diacetyllegionaminic acid synthase
MRPRILAHIPARGGSKGLPGKNLRTVLGISLVGWAVLAAKRLRTLVGDRAQVRILVDTDCDAIAEEAAQWGAEVPFRRPPTLALDESPTAPAVIHALDRFRDAGWLPDGVVLLQPTSPLRSGEDALQCLEPFLDGRAESVVSVAPLEHPLELAQRADPSGRLASAGAMAGGAMRRQDGTAACFPTGAVYVVAAGLLRATGRFLHEEATLGITIARSRSLDIDTEVDLRLAESVARGEAMMPDPAGDGIEGAGSWPVIRLDQLAAGLSRRVEEESGSVPAGVRATAAAGMGAMELFDALAACRRVTGLPVAWEIDPGHPERSGVALSAGACALLVPGADGVAVAAAEREVAGWSGRRVLPT